MNNQERALLLTVARLLRAHMKDHIHHPDFSDIDLDYSTLNEALAPFEPSMVTVAEREAAALVILASYGVEPDVQELLVNGDQGRGIRPGALRAALSTSDRSGQ